MDLKSASLQMIFEELTIRFQKMDFGHQIFKAYIGRSIFHLGAVMKEYKMNGKSEGKMNIEEAKKYLVEVMNEHFRDKTFTDYIKNRLSGDFAVEMARTMKKIKASDAANETLIFNAWIDAGFEALDTDNFEPDYAGMLQDLSS